MLVHCLEDGDPQEALGSSFYVPLVKPYTQGTGFSGAFFGLIGRFRWVGTPAFAPAGSAGEWV